MDRRCGLAIGCAPLPFSPYHDVKLMWQIPFGRSCYASVPDTRTTPTVVGNLIYVVSGNGEMACINAGNGPYWAHPTIYQGILYLRHGDVLAAYNLHR